MPRAGVTRERIVAVAAEVADEAGLEALTLSAVAQRLGVSGPAMYKHVAGLDALRRDLAVRALEDLTTALSAATVGRSGSDALRALADAYRTYGLRHPGRLAASIRAPAPGDTEHDAASDRALAVLVAVLRGFGITDDDMVDALRTTRSWLHGFVTLEAAGGFALARERDATFSRYVTTLDAGLKSWH